MNTVIESARLRFRQLTADDVDFVLAITSDPDWLYFIGDRGVKDPDQARQYIDTSHNSFSQQGYGLWVVESDAVEGDSRVGLCGFLQRSFLACPDLGYAFLPHGRGQGLALEAATLALKWAKQHNLHGQISAICRCDNQRSLQLLEKAGFTSMGKFFQRGVPAHQFFLISIDNQGASYAK
ncbi:GNAT family N-acetyltransferase [Aestuariibacter sp. GS-14]|uniref:GNAT family N-acetyltransferase n=1 Tax=Aestuariibacter sp. GS-14 TaxID=2590670 RepID=UPI0015E83B88|nr:GNAT family N-acetyltransferase [Aestuariibacter sp. GS-14]